MINFILGISITINILCFVFISFLYKKLNSKISNKDIEKFILKNFMECDNL